jgi:hypothetical protein
VLTDGQTQFCPSVSPECFAHLHPQASLYGLFRVQKYTIRYTSYGPPSEKLQFILEAVDGLGHDRAGVPRAETGGLTPLRPDLFVHILRLLDITRAREDRRCLGADTRSEEEADEMPPAMHGTDDASQGASQPHTQYAFGTQLPSPMRVRPAEDEPQIVGVKSLEPVLAGNTQREDIRPNTKSAREQLLSLLGRGGSTVVSKSTEASSKVSPCAAAKRSQMSAEQPGTQLYTQLPVHANRQPNQTQSASEVAVVSLPQPSRSTKRVTEIEPFSPKADKDIHKDRNFSATAHERHSNPLQKFVSQCSWMKDMEFTREAFKVPYSQTSLLQHDDSWHKSMPGRKFPSGNVPIEILTTLRRIADEKAAMEAGPDSEDELDEDPSPESPVDAIEPSQKSMLAVTQDEQRPSSPAVSWSSSPPPEPPQMPSRLYQGLPPDSSFEAAEPAAKYSPARTTAPLRLQNPIVVDLSNETEQIDPPSSPPVAKEIAVLGEDVEMEDYVPQGLGEDCIERADESPGRRVLSASPSPRPVVQVKETPYASGKNGQHQVQTASSPKMEVSSGLSKNTSSASIVHGTYNNKSSSDLQSNAFRADISGPVPAVRPGGVISQLKEPQQSVTRDSDNRVSGGNDKDVIMLDTIGPEASAQQEHVEMEHTTWNTVARDTKPQTPAEATPVSAQLRPEDPELLTAATSETRLDPHRVQEKAVLPKSRSLTPGAVKRKHDNSPSKKSGRHSKRREIKLLDLNIGSLPPAQTTSTWRSYREESLRKFRESRNSGTSLENELEPANRKVEILRDEGVVHVDSPVVLENDASVADMSPRHGTRYGYPNPDKPAALPSRSASETSPDTQVYLIPDPKLSSDTRAYEQSQPAATTSSEASLNIFESFKAAYPKYTGDTKHFQSQCIQMIRLDEQDKMVPKWQWDDFIIRNRTDYREYAMECVDQGEDPEPYHRFYKDTIRDTIHKKGIIKGRSTLLQALQQFNVRPPLSEAQDSPDSGPEKEQRPRKSLPSAFSYPKAPSKNHSNIILTNQPRHSLPATLQDHHTSLNDRHAAKLRVPTPQPNPLTRDQLNGAAPLRSSSPREATPGTGDPYRDFYFASLRTTSLTGSTKVSSKDELSEAQQS